jgi:hypothetical protein
MSCYKQSMKNNKVGEESSSLKTFKLNCLNISAESHDRWVLAKASPLQRMTTRLD